MAETPPYDLSLIQEHLRNMETKAEELSRQTKDLEGEKLALEQKMAQLDKDLAQEKAKTMLTNLRTQEEKSLTLKVESNLREIQDKLRRDQRERELEAVRVKLETQIKDLERKLAQEREIWVETLRSQMAKKGLDDNSIDERLASRVREIETRFVQERSRLLGKVEEKTREIEDLKKQALLGEENLRVSYEKRIAELESQIKILESKAEELTSELQEQAADAQKHREASVKVEAYRRVLRERDALLERAKLALVKLRREREFWQSDQKQTASLKERVVDLEVSLGRVVREKARILEAAKTKIRKILEQDKALQNHQEAKIENLEVQLKELEAGAARGFKEAEAVNQEKEFLTAEIDKKDKELARLSVELEAAQRSSSQVEVLLKELELVRGKNAVLEDELGALKPSQEKLQKEVSVAYRQLTSLNEQFQEEHRERLRWAEKLEEAKRELWESKRNILKNEWALFSKFVENRLSSLAAQSHDIQSFEELKKKIDALLEN